MILKWTANNMPDYVRHNITMYMLSSKINIHVCGFKKLFEPGVRLSLVSIDIMWKKNILSYVISLKYATARTALVAA